MPAAVIAEISYLTTEVFWPVYGAIMFLLFPISLLAVLETDSSVTPISQPIFRSLSVGWKSWLAFYLSSGVLIAAFSGMFYFTLKHLGGSSAPDYSDLSAQPRFLFTVACWADWRG